MLDSASDVGFLTEYKQNNPDADILFRATFPDDAPNDPDWRIETLVNRAAPIRHLLTGVLTTRNEWRQDSKQDMIFAALFTLGEAQMLRERGFTNIIGGSFSTTKPDLRWWLEWVSIAGPYLDGYAFHEYARSSIDTGGQYHYRDVWAATPEQLRKPFYITEGGLDNDRGGGWRHIEGVSAQSYATQMRAYLIEVWKDEYVKNVFLYQDGAVDHRWDSWSYSGVPALEDLFKQGHIRKETTVMPDDKIKTYANWSLARISGDQSPTDIAAFKAHIKALGGDPSNLVQYGCPTVLSAAGPDVSVINDHADAIKAAVAPFL